MFGFADSSMLFYAIRCPAVSFFLRVSCGLLFCLVVVDVTAAQDGGIGAEAESRVWTDSKGREVEAVFVRMDEMNVVLRRKKDGKEFPFPIQNLTRDDRSVAIKMAVQQRKEEHAKHAAGTAPLGSSNGPMQEQSSEPESNAVPERFDAPDNSPAPRRDSTAGNNSASSNAPNSDKARRRIEEMLDRSRRRGRGFGPNTNSMMQRGRDRHDQMIEDARSGRRSTMSGRGIGVPSSRLAPSGSGFPSNPGLSSNPVGDPSFGPAIPLVSSEPSYVCSGCNGKLTEETGAGDNCPHCGVFISEAIRPDGKHEIAINPNRKKQSSQSNRSRTRVSGRGIRALVRIGLFVVLGVGGLFAKLFSGKSR